MSVNVTGPSSGWFSATLVTMNPVPADAMRSTVAALERLGHFPGLRAERPTPVSR